MGKFLNDFIILFYSLLVYPLYYNTLNTPKELYNLLRIFSYEQNFIINFLLNVFFEYYLDNDLYNNTIHFIYLFD
jgi:hypothetical protein